MINFDYYYLMPINRSIKTLEIKNFQSHAHTIINFDEGINIVQGTSNAGKSAINRAIVWALGNKPRGDFFIKKGTSCASVKITFYDNSYFSLLHLYVFMIIS